jgi:outer membrane cobalamin receptor
MFLRQPLLLLLIPGALAAQTVALDPVVVSASRAPESTAHVAFPVTTFSAEALRGSPSTAIDSVLRASPAFSLFRRSDSLTANPTAQGVSLRGLGPSGASRSLVLLDGVPLNDPFGGWVSWAKIPRESLAAAEIVRGGGATAWGNAALGGVIQLLTEPLATAHNRVAVSAGDFSTHSEELVLAQPIGPGTLQLSGNDFGTSGGRRERRFDGDGPAF